MCESVVISATRANETIGIRPCLVHIDNFLIDGEAMAVGFLKKDKQRGLYFSYRYCKVQKSYRAKVHSVQLVEK